MASRQASSKRLKDHAALAGLVEGSFTAEMPVFGKRYFLYSFSAVAPLAKTGIFPVCSKIGVKSTGTTSLMELSLLPTMVHFPPHHKEQFRDEGAFLFFLPLSQGFPRRKGWP